MYIIIAGCGQTGASLALRLSREGHDIAVIDRTSKSFDLLGHGFNGLTVVGVPIDEDVLKEAGIENADALAAMTSDDNMNIMISEIARKLYKVGVVVMRADTPEREDVLAKLGYETVCPTRLAVDLFEEKILKGASHI
ncbi:MAG: TrkA family potassium uptake protein [Oscillospiraceae bacterium]